MTRPATPADVDAICRLLPEVELGISWGNRPTYKVPKGAKGRGFVLYRAPNKNAIDPATGEPYDDLLVITVPDESAKLSLVDDSSTPFFTIDHFKGYDAVLVQESRLGEAQVDELTEILTDAWLSVAPKALTQDFLANHFLANG